MEHDSQEVESSTAVPAEPRTKRRVNYNPEAVLCPVCTKRIRLNNDGRIRVHTMDKMGSGQCMGSGKLAVAAGLPMVNDIPSDEKKAPAVVFQKEDGLPLSSIFSDSEN